MFAKQVVHHSHDDRHQPVRTDDALDNEKSAVVYCKPLPIAVDNVSRPEPVDRLLAVAEVLLEKPEGSPVLERRLDVGLRAMDLA